MCPHCQEGNGPGLPPHAVLSSVLGVSFGSAQGLVVTASGPLNSFQTWKCVMGARSAVWLGGKWGGRRRWWAPVFWRRCCVHVDLDFPSWKVRLTWSLLLLCSAHKAYNKSRNVLVCLDPHCHPCWGLSAASVLCRETSLCPDPPLFLSCLIGLSLKIVILCRMGLFLSRALLGTTLWITSFLVESCHFL